MRQVWSGTAAILCAPRFRKSRVTPRAVDAVGALLVCALATVIGIVVMVAAVVMLMMVMVRRMTTMVGIVRSVLIGGDIAAFIAVLALSALLD
jgi:hypothetical protein